MANSRGVGVNFAELFKYDPKLGLLYRNGVPVMGPQQVDGRSYTAEQICFAIYHGYVPAYICRWSDETKCYPIANLYDPAAQVDPESELRVYAVRGKYPEVYAVNSRRKGRQYQGRFKVGRRRHKTPVFDTAEAAFSLIAILKAQLELQEQQKENAQ